MNETTAEIIINAERYKTIRAALVTKNEAFTDAMIAALSAGSICITEAQFDAAVDAARAASGL